MTAIRQTLGAGLVFLLALLLASPASALCYECRKAGTVCGIYGCLDTYTCGVIQGLCGQCWADCQENSDLYCSMWFPCQWAQASPAPSETLAQSHRFQSPCWYQNG